MHLSHVLVSHDQCSLLCSNYAQHNLLEPTKNQVNFCIEQSYFHQFMDQVRLDRVNACTLPKGPHLALQIWQTVLNLYMPLVVYSLQVHLPR